ncbi:hypothetical protein AB4259_17745 [Vibrio amylolyticus]|uniref:hypothetical protein n=1 Tax=Vibrio amylolyticus TaxID=2847292 RepID=UPI00355414AC
MRTWPSLPFSTSEFNLSHFYNFVTGVIVKGEDFRPSADGVTIYLNGGDNLQVILDRVVKNNGRTIIPKTPHADEVGYFAIFLDSEGNKIGLHSPN